MNSDDTVNIKEKKPSIEGAFETNFYDPVNIFVPFSGQQQLPPPPQQPQQREYAGK